MTTKPRQTTSKRRHSAASAHAKKQLEYAALERELRRELNAMHREGAPQSEPRPESFRPYVVWSVRHPDGGLPFRFEWKGAKGMWRSVMESEAVKAIRRAGLVPHAHIETVLEAPL